MPFSEIFLNINESATLAITKKVRELKAKGKDVVGLTLGEPDFDTPEHIKQAAIQALKDNITHYPPVAGYPDLRQAIAAKFARENNLEYKPENVVVSTGAKQSLFNVFNAVLNRGEEVVLPTPCWVSYIDMLKIVGAKVVEVECGIEESFKISPEKLEASLTSNTKMLVFCTPSNPTGSMYSREELAELVKVLEKYPDVYIVTDEIYEHIAFNHKHVSIAEFPSVFERCIVINGLSKSFAMTGWRLGYMAAYNKEITFLSEKVQGQVTSGANSITQKAAVAALNGPMDEVWAMRDAFHKRRDSVFPKLQAIEGLNCILPDGAFYFYPDVSHFIGKSTPEGMKIDNIDELCLYLIDCGVAVIPGSAFGTQNHLRISYAYAIPELEKGMDRLAHGLGLLK
ncbi:MAG: pyridoxal phosphate-dependent aminotransferase [Bacteroidia bacterium]|nr:pyridoxal phosphate-dependent aminotransferase [Bacteroidia bacterium]